MEIEWIIQRVYKKSKVNVLKGILYNIDDGDMAYLDSFFR